MAQNIEMDYESCWDFGNRDNNGQSYQFPLPSMTLQGRCNGNARFSLPPLAIGQRSLEEWPKAAFDDTGGWTQCPPTPRGDGTAEMLRVDKLPIQDNSDDHKEITQREKMTLFEKECSKVAEHLYFGGNVVARDRDILKQNGITHILNCVGFVCPEYFRTEFVYKTLWFFDSPSEDITSILYDVFDYFEYVREQGGRVFVHCWLGVSRSTSLVIAYLMWREGWTYNDAFRYVRSVREIIDPNLGFTGQILQCEKRVHGVPLSPSSLLRMYRVAPHSPYDPLHLVPKMLDEPCPSALDSRGAFIVLVQSTIYVWIGKQCNAIMERKAIRVVYQIILYERVQGRVIQIKEEIEPTCFWNAFSNFLPLMGNSGSIMVTGESSSIKKCPCERRVDSYDIDYEIFRKAIMGGFFPPIASPETDQETRLPARENCWNALKHGDA